MTLEFLKEKFQEYNLTSYWEKVANKAKKSINMTLKHVNEDEIKLGSTKFGGVPHLPKNMSWFKDKNEEPMSFVGQINFEEVAIYDTENKLPSTGILYLFYDIEQPWGFDPKDKGAKKIFYFTGQKSELTRTEKPNNIDNELFFKPGKVSFQPSIDVLDYWSSLINFDLTEEENERYWNLKQEIFQEPIHKLLGHSNNIQVGMELECELVTNGLYCGEPSVYETPKAKELAKNIDQWQLLLQVDTDDETEMFWGADGRIYLWIKEEDLKNKDFEKSWLILQCY
jgi:uncharacterized protein YwqG